MHSNNNPRIISLALTLLIALLFTLFLFLCPVLATSGIIEPVKKGEIELLAEEVEEFVDFIEPVPQGDGLEPEPAHLDEPQVTESQPAPASGTDLRNSGPQGETPPVVTQTQPSPVKQQKEDTKAPAGQAQQPKESETDKVNREVTENVAGKLNKGDHNASTSNTADNGNSGTTAQASGTAVVSGLNGTGWIIPKYNPVKSSAVGSIEATVKIDASGNVVSVVITGGDPPAATNPTVRAAVERELKSRKFTRANYSDAQPATAYIKYRFK